MIDRRAQTQQEHSRRTRMPLVFICSPYRGDTQTNEQHARTYCSLAVSRGCIRYRGDVKPGMWVKFRGDKWIISTLGEYSFQKTYLGLKASIAKGVSG
ncbi:MAG: hypothetical protein ACI4MG_09675 [Aristaeellaceae bacterium]